MLIHSLKITWCNLIKHKVYSLINIFGLSIGLACSMLILVYVLHEFSYDRFHEKANRIHRVGREITSAEGEVREPVTPAPLAPAMLQDFPDLEAAFRLKKSGRSLIRFEDNKFQESKLYFSDPAIFDVFTLSMIQGDPNTALDHSNSVVITKEMAEKYFGFQNPMGQNLLFDHKHEYRITGIIENLPETSHLDIQMLISFSTLQEQWPELNDWHTFGCSTYLLFKENTNPQQLAAQFPDFINRHIKKDQENLQGTLNFYLNPLTKIHLHSQIDGNSPGLISQVTAYSALATFIALIACINFINLSTARSTSRAKEIGLRKVIGAKRHSLINQLILEAILVSVFASVLAYFLVELFLPVFSDKISETLILDFQESPHMLIGFIILTFLMGIMAGGYPAIVLSRLNILDAFKKNAPLKRKRFQMRSALVVVQFLLSTILIVQTYRLYHQIDYLKNKDVGFNKNNLIILPILDNKMRQSLKVFKYELIQNTAIHHVSAISSKPGTGIGRAVKIPQGYSKNDMQLMDEIYVDADFISTMGLTLKEGRNFSEKNPTDKENALIINELAAQKFGWDHPIGKTIQYSVGEDQYATGTVVGLVEDFHISSLYKVIEPLFISNQYDKANHLMIRIESGQTDDALASIEDIWQSHFPNLPFKYKFLDESYDRYFRTLDEVIDVMMFFSVLAIILACLGIFALATFWVERKTKEIGIRKVLGDSTPRIVIRLNLEILKFVIIAAIISIVYSYFTRDFMGSMFPYQANMNHWIYIHTFGLVFILAALSISYQAIRAAAANPVESLRYE